MGQKQVRWFPIITIFTIVTHEVVIICWYKRVRSICFYNTTGLYHATTRVQNITNILLYIHLRRVLWHARSHLLHYWRMLIYELRISLVIFMRVSVYDGRFLVASCIVINVSLTNCSWIATLCSWVALFWSGHASSSWIPTNAARLRVSMTTRWVVTITSGMIMLSIPTKLWPNKYYAK